LKSRSTRVLVPILVFAMILTITLGGALVSCRTEEQVMEEIESTAEEFEGEKDITIGIIVEAYGNEWFQELIAEAKKVAAEEDVTLLIDSSEWDAAKETQIFDDFIQREVDGIAVALAQEAATRENLWKATQEGIPCITLILEIRGGPQCTVIKHDNYGGSYNEGAWAAGYFMEMGGTDANLAILELPIYQSTIDRANGFIDGFKSVMPEAEVVAQQNAEGVMEKGMSAMETMIQSNPDINVVFGINDPCALGAASAIESAGMMDAIVCGFDGSGDSKKAIAEGGVFKASVLVDSVDYGRRIVHSLVALAEGRADDVTFWQLVDDIVLTPENIDDYL